MQGSAHLRPGDSPVAATVSPVQSYPAYPDPPTVFAITPDVESMWGRWTGYMNDREPLASMASMCLTILEAGAGGRPDERRTSAAAKYGVARDVLELLGDLTSDVGEAQTGREAHVSRRSPHTQRRGRVDRVGDPSAHPAGRGGGLRPWSEMATDLTGRLPTALSVWGTFTRSTRRSARIP